MRNALQSRIQTATPFLGALILRGFREPSSATAIPNLPRSTYFAWFSCPQQCYSDAQPSSEHVFCVVFVRPAAPQQRPTFPGARILHGFRAPSSATATPNLPRSTYFAYFSSLQQWHSNAQPFPEHVFYMVFVPPAVPQQRPTFPGARVLRDFRIKNTHFHCKIHAFSLTLL